MNKYSLNAKKALEQAEQYALFSGNVVDTTHLLIGITAVKSSLGAEILLRLGFSESIAGSYFLRTSNKISDKVIVSPTLKKVLEYANMVTQDANNTIGTQHLLLAITYHKNCSGNKILIRHNISYEKVLSIVEGITAKGIEDNNYNNSESNDTKEITIINPQVSNDEELSKYGVNLNERARNGEIDPLIGREDELNRIIRILSRKKKNSPIIVGRSGVGKTAIIEGLAQKIVNGDVPSFLKEKVIFSLNVNSLVAGTKYRGELEEKLDILIKKVIEKKYILFIDELHTVLTAGGTDGGLNVGGILKPALNDPSLLVIGATTTEEYSKYIEKDGAFERRFIKVLIEEPTEEECIRIMQRLKENFEQHYSLKIDDKVLIQAVKLSNRYITSRCLPDKAIDVLDEACSKKVLDDSDKIVTTSDVKDVVSEMTGIPISNLSLTQSQHLMNIENVLAKKIIGQEKAISILAKALRRSYSGLKDRNKPIGSFIFLGTTGVGKTETAKILSEFLFGSEQALIRFDMSEYMEKSNVSRLLGASPGYIGYESGGTLTEAVKNKPYSILLFDEIEKAHPDVFNVFLQLLDEGRLTDGKGRTVDFRNTIIIMTSNVGTDKLYNQKRIGFNNTIDALDEEKIQIDALKGIMKPEFINRIDSIVVFEKLNKENLIIITNNIIERKKKVLFEEKGIKLDCTKEVIEYIATKALEENYGARPVKRQIEKILEDKLSEIIISQDLRNSTVRVIMKDTPQFVIDEKQEAIYET